MKIILVTGGNRGIGFEICRQLGELGHSVILGSRNFKAGNKAAKSIGKNVVATQLDVTSEESIMNAFNNIISEFGKLDVLINNAGLGERQNSYQSAIVSKAKNFLESNVYGVKQMNRMLIPILRKGGIVNERKTAVDVSIMNVKRLMETNFYGAWRMIQVFIPLLKKSEDARIINVSSGMGELSRLTGEDPGYSLSKASLNDLTIMFSNELFEDGIKVNAMCPGWVRTDMGGANAPRNVSEGADTVVWLTTEKEIPTGKFFRDRTEISW